jgi:cell division protein ZapA
MPVVTVSIGGRDYAVACQEGEEAFLRAAAAMLDTEATALGAQLTRLPESRVLLMAGLMLADKAAGLDDQVKSLEARLAERETQIEMLRSRPAPAPDRVEVLPAGLQDRLAELAAVAEALAETAESGVSAA